MNYAVFGNLVPHVHCHILPRFRHDDSHAPIRINFEQELLEEHEYQKIINDLRSHLSK